MGLFESILLGGFAAILAALLCALFYVGWMVYRNEKVYRYRVYLIHTDPQLYDTLPDYETMVRDFINWPTARLDKRAQPIGEKP